MQSHLKQSNEKSTRPYYPQGKSIDQFMDNRFAFLLSHLRLDDIDLRATNKKHDKFAPARYQYLIGTLLSLQTLYNSLHEENKKNIKLVN